MKISFIVQMDRVSNRRWFVMVIRIVQMAQTRTKNCVLYTNMKQVCTRVQNNCYNLYICLITKRW